MGRMAFPPFPARGEKLRPDTGLPKKAEAREMGTKEGMQAKVWREVAGMGSARRAEETTQVTGISSDASGPSDARGSTVLTSGLSTEKRMILY